MLSAKTRTVSQVALRCRNLLADDLAEVNSLVRSAVGCWDIAERVKQLALGSLLYDEVDFRFLLFHGIFAENRLAGLVCLEQIAGKDDEMLIHGLYVKPDMQRKGLGRRLIAAAVEECARIHAENLAVRAERGAVGFFKRLGFEPYYNRDEWPQYPHSLILRVDEKTDQNVASRSCLAATA